MDPEMAAVLKGWQEMLAAQHAWAVEERARVEREAEAARAAAPARAEEETARHLKSQRAWFAGMALQGLLQREPAYLTSNCVEQAVVVADALIAELAKVKP